MATTRMTNEGKRNQSRLEFDNTYFAVDDDIESLISSNYGLSGEKLAKYQIYLNSKSQLLEKLSQTLFLHLKMANGLYPTCKEQLEERQMHQKLASGACYGIATLYERIFNHVGIPRDKHVDKIKHIQKEINSIKAWKESDKKRFKF